MSLPRIAVDAMGGDEGVRGFVGAYDQATGKEIAQCEDCGRILYIED